MKKIFLTTLVLSAASLATNAWAITADEAKASGLVYETCDGYVRGTDAKGREIAEEINSKRRKEYEKIANQRGVSVLAVAKLFGQELCGK